MIAVFYFMWYTTYVLYYFYYNFKTFLIKKKFFSKIKFFSTPRFFSQLNVLDRLILVFFYRPNSSIFKFYEIYVTDIKNIDVIRKLSYPLIWQLFNENFKGSLEGRVDLTFNDIRKLKKIISRNLFLKNLVTSFKQNFSVNDYATLILITNLKFNLIDKNFFTNLYKNKINKNSNETFFNNDNVDNSFLLTETYVLPSYKGVSKFIFFKKVYNFFKTRLLVESDLSYYWRYLISLNLLTSKFNVNSEWADSIKKFWTIKINPSTVSKFLNEQSTDKQTIYFLRKNRIFNKGRYSRNRQLYRTGVYWCIWLSILLAYGLYFALYRFTLNFGYFWWITFAGLSIFFFNRSVKYHHYSIKYLTNDVQNNLLWVRIIVYSLISTTVSIYNVVVNKLIFFKNQLIFFKTPFIKYFFVTNLFNRNYSVEDLLFINLLKD